VVKERPSTTLQSEAGAAEWTLPASGVEPSAARGSPLEGRYEDLRLIGSGGFGEVRRAFDRKLGRAVAMKIARPDVDFSPRQRARFLAEIALTAGLSHPGIVAVHDYGELDDGRLWFTMSEVRGRTFRAVVDEVLSAGGGPAISAPSRRLLDVFHRVCETIAYAHSAGVIHRDLKPENIMVGEFGQVMVMDWGIARRIGEVARDGEERASVAAFAEEIDGALTRQGDVLGTPAYMPPEQAMGEIHRHGPATDVYALGAILFHVLAGRPPRAWLGLHGHEAIRSALEELQGAPAELVAICARAMARQSEERHANAGELADELSLFLAGARRREQALAELDEATKSSLDLAALRERAEGLRGEARRALVTVRPFDAACSKAPGWALEDEAERLEREVALREAEWIQSVHEALAIDPALPEAHAVLADHYREKLADAELGRRHADAARFEVLLRAHDRGKHAAFLRGDGAVTLVTDPPGAEVLLYRYVPRERRLAAELVRSLGPSPVRAVELPRGSYLLRIRAPGRAEVSYPVLVERGEHWDGCAPGETEPFPIALPRETDLGPDDVYVPAGHGWIGGDPEASDSLPRRRVWIDAFIVRRYPVTCRELLEFLNDILVHGTRGVDLGVPPSHPGVIERSLDHPALERNDEGLFVLRESDGGPFWHPDCPIIADWYEASAYARWLATKDGKPWRLPNELEREKAARGADGRLLPWGDFLDPAFACVLEGHRGEPARERVDGHPADLSPYGVRGLAGNSRDWCINVWRHEGPRTEEGRVRLDAASPDDPDFRVIKGGAWGSTMVLARSAARFGYRPASRSLWVGFRLARSYPA
jgi:formylglycine-generating enzyme required for sulfatase activity/tRNA A-37 threonylcarbamoyl transferase component Bud32